MLAGLVLIVLFLSVPVAHKLTNRQKTYHTYFEDESVSGLEEGGDVKFRGVRIGKISDIKYDRKDLSRVRVEFRVSEDFPMKEGMQVQTQLMGITMLKYLEIAGGTDPEAELLPDGSEIPNKPSGLEALTGKTDVIVAKVELLLNHLTTLTHPDSLASVREIMTNVAAISGEMRTFTETVSPDVQGIAASARSSMEKIDAISGDIQTMTSNVNRSIDSERLGQILSSIDSSAVSLKKLSETVELTIRQSREDITVSMENLRETLENANDLSRMLADNPSLLLRSEQQKARSW
jgi:phospholipid/cholesterol/gamma-HCH transport system substrate-binding protein